MPVAVAVVALIGMAVAGCSSSSSSARSITLYSGQHEQTTIALVAAFQAQTGIHVNLRSDDEDVLAQQIETEGSSSPADVFYTENSPPLEALQGKGLLAPVSSSALAAVPSQYNSPQGDWLGLSARVSVLVYNTSDLPSSQVPTSVLDLAKPQWRGKLGIAPGETDFQPIVTSVARAYGMSAALTWLKGVKSNGAAHNYPDNETLVSEVNGGQVQLGLIDHYYWYRLRQELGAAKMHSAVAYFAPQDPGYVVDVSGAGVLKSSRHQAEAQQFLAFLVSAPGEHIIATSDSWEYPLGSAVAANPALKPFSSLQPNSITIADLGDGSNAVKLLQEAQLL
jgi:iron(III) transport system substrate-binding protein